jgi:hypothetical protein
VLPAVAVANVTVRRTAGGRAHHIGARNGAVVVAAAAAVVLVGVVSTMATMMMMILIMMTRRRRRRMQRSHSCRGGGQARGVVLAYRQNLQWKPYRKRQLERSRRAPVGTGYLLQASKPG